MNNGTITVAAGQTVTFNGGQVTSATLDGAGTFATSAANGAQFINVTTTPSVAIVSNNANDRFVHVNNSGAFSLAAGVNPSGNFTPTNLNGFINQGLGSVTIGNGSQLNVANFQSYGTMTLVPATGGGFTELANTGTSPLGFNGGSQTFIGSAAAPNANTSGVDLRGQNMIISGGLFVNNGSVGSTGGSGTVYVEYGATYKGAGTNNVIDRHPERRQGALRQLPRRGHLRQHGRRQRRHQQPRMGNQRRRPVGELPECSRRGRSDGELGQPGERLEPGAGGQPNAANRLRRPMAT